MPVAKPITEGRILGTDWTIAHVAKLLRSNAGRGAWDASALSGSAQEVNQYYLRKTSARHTPSNTSVIFLRLAKPSCWYASLCFSGAYGLLPWNPAVAELWLTELFGEARPRVREEGSELPSVRQFYCDVP